MIQNVLFAVSVLIFFRLKTADEQFTRGPIFNYATNVWAPLKATTDCIPIKDKKKLHSLHNSDFTVIGSTPNKLRFNESTEANVSGGFFPNMINCGDNPKKKPRFVQIIELTLIISI